MAFRIGNPGSRLTPMPTRSRARIVTPETHHNHRNQELATEAHSKHQRQVFCSIRYSRTVVMPKELSMQAKRWRTIIVTLPIIGATSCTPRHHQFRSTRMLTHKRCSLPEAYPRCSSAYNFRPRPRYKTQAAARRRPASSASRQNPVGAPKAKIVR